MARKGVGWAEAAPRIPGWFGEFFGFLALFCAALAVIEPLRRLLEPVRRWVEILTVPASPNLAYAAFLVLLGGAMAARKRVAYWIVAVFLGLTVLANVVLAATREWSAIPALLITGTVLGAVIAARGEFSARVRKGAFWRALWVLVCGLAAGVLLGWGMLSLFPGSLEGGNRLRWAVNKVVGGVNDLPDGIGHPPYWTNFWLGLFGAAALLAAAAALFRSQQVEAALHGDDESRIRTLLDKYGEQDSLGYFATRRDKSVVFSPSGKSAVTFRVEVGVCLASGDPLGDREAWGPAIDAWLAHAAAYGWAPAVMGSGEEGAKAYARAGLGALELGDEAILDVTAFDLSGRDMRGIRQAVNRVRRTGATVRIRRHHELSAPELAEVVGLADAWRDTDTERGFSMALGRLGDPADGECLLVEALDAAGRVIALLSFAPWGTDGVSLDVMRRDRAAPNGIMEFMVTELAAGAGALGVRRVSLNFAVFRSVFEEGARIGAGPVLRLWRRLLLFFSRWWQLEALYRSNVKYQPQWVPRFLCYSEAKDLARIGLASGIAEGFVERPRLRLRLPFRRDRLPAGVTGAAPAAAVPAAACEPPAAAKPPPAEPAARKAAADHPRPTREAGAGVVVKVAVPGDVEVAAGLFREYLDFYEVRVEDAGRPRAYLAERVERGDSVVLLASAPGAGTVGFAQIYPVLSSLDLGPAWLLSDLFVTPSGRRHGVGRALLRDVLRRAREAGVSGVQLETAYDNGAAQGLYEAEGFVRDGHHVYVHDLH